MKYVIDDELEEYAAKGEIAWGMRHTSPNKARIGLIQAQGLSKEKSKAPRGISPELNGCPSSVLLFEICGSNRYPTSALRRPGDSNAGKVL